MIRQPPISTPLYSSAASDVYKRQLLQLSDSAITVFTLSGFRRFSPFFSKSLTSFTLVITVASEYACFFRYNRYSFSASFSLSPATVFISVAVSNFFASNIAHNWLSTVSRLCLYDFSLNLKPHSRQTKR